MTLSDPVLLAVLAAIGAGFLRLVMWMKEDRDYWRDAFMRLLDSTEVTADLAEKSAPPAVSEKLSPRAADAAQRIVRRTRRA